jgi:PAS domain S-box-containing protein
MPSSTSPSKRRWRFVRRRALRHDTGNEVARAFHDIKDLKLTEEAIRRSQAYLAQARRQLQLTIDTIPALVVSYHADGRCDFVNRTWQDYTGITLQEARGEGRPDFHPDDIDRVDSAWRASLATGEPFSIELRARRADGEYLWHSIRRVPLRNNAGEITKWYGVGFDIEDRKRAESALQRSEAYLAEAQRLNHSGSFGWNVSSGEIFWSEGTFRIFGYAPTANVTIDMVLNRVHPDDLALVERVIDHAARHKDAFDFEHRLQMPDGSVKHLQAVARVLVDEPQNLQFAGAVMDITAHKATEQALQRLRADFAHAARISMLGELTASVAHEVNQPLAAIVAGGEASLRWLARPTPNVDEIRELTKRVAADARRASEIIARIRAMATRHVPEQTLLSLDDVIREALLFLRHELQSRGVAVTHVPASGSQKVLADRTQLQQVIVNLAVNAEQAIAQAGSTNRNITFRTVVQDSTTLRCSVEDSGPGIEPQHVTRLFDSFFTTKQSGMGMGLGICRSVVEAHGGRIAADNESALGGARFFFTLPIADAAT